MRISIIANGFQEDYIINLLNAISNNDHNIDFIGSSIYNNQLLHPSINFLNIRGEHTENVFFGKKIKRLLVYYIKFIKYLLNEKPDIIHVQWLRLNFIEGIILTIIIKLLGIKAVYTAHDVLPHMKNTYYNVLLFKLIYKLQDHIIVHTEYIKNRIVRNLKINESKISIIKHGVYKVDENSQLTSTMCRKEFKIDADGIVFLFFGIITKYKGVYLLLESFNKIVRENEKSFLIIAGRISNEYVNEFENLISKNNHKHIVRILRFIKKEEVECLFKAADVVVLPYLEASQSGVLFMSYAYGKPVIAPNLGGFPYDIIENKTGLLFEAGNPESLFNTMKSFETSYSDMFAYSETYIKKYSIENYSWEISGKKMIEIYNKL